MTVNPCYRPQAVPNLFHSHPASACHQHFIIENHDQATLYTGSKLTQVHWGRDGQSRDSNLGLTSSRARALLCILVYLSASLFYSDYG